MSLSLHPSISSNLNKAIIAGTCFLLSLTLCFNSGSAFAQSSAGDLLWSTEFEESVDYSSPTVLDGVAYIAAENMLYALNISSGTVLWETQLQNTIYESPSVVDGVIYVADQYRIVYAIEASSGEIAWIRDEEVTFAPARGLTTVFGDVVYVSTGSDNNRNNGWLRALRSSTGEMIWEYETTGAARGNSPVVSDGRVFIGDDLGKIYAIDTQTGEELWVFEEDFSRVNASSTVYEGVLYSVLSKILPDDGTSDVPLYDAYIYALDAETGEEIWEEPIVEYAAQMGGWSSPTVFDGALYVGIHHNLYSVDVETGTINWEFETDSFVMSSPTVAGGVVFVGSNDRFIYAIDTANGTEIWSLETPYQVRSSPVVLEGVVYIGADLFVAGDPDVIGSGEAAGYLYAIESGVTASSQDSRVLLGTLNHHFGLPPFLKVTILSTNSPAREGENLEVTATIRNLGVTDTQTIRLENFEGETADQQEVTLDRNQSETITLNWLTAEGDAAYDSVAVRSLNHVDRISAAVMQEANVGGCSEINTPGYYTLIGSFGATSNCIRITSSYVEFDGNDNRIHFISGNLTNGIVIDGGEEGIEHVTVKNVVVEDFKVFDVNNGGIVMNNVSHGEMYNVTSRDNYWAVKGENVNNFTFRDNIFDGNEWYGIWLEESRENLIQNVDVLNSFYGIWLDQDSNHNRIEDSNVSGHYYGFIVGSSHSIDYVNVRSYDNQTFAFGDPGDIYTYFGSHSINIENVHIGLEDSPGLRASFSVSDDIIGSVESPGEHPELMSLESYFWVKVNNPGNPLEIDIHYDLTDFPAADESELVLKKFEGDDEEGEWIAVDPFEIDTEEKTISAALTEDGIYGVFSGELAVSVEPSESVTHFELHQNYPNPFNPVTVIGYQLPISGDVSLKVYDLLGREVTTLVDSQQSAGIHQVKFDASNLASGVYIYRIQAENYVETRQMTLIK